MQAMADPDLLAEAHKAHLDISPMSGADVQAMVEGLYHTPQAIKDRAREVLGGK